MEKCMSAVIFAKCRAKMRMPHGRKASTAPSALLAASLISLKILLLAVVANAFPAIHPSNACLGEKHWNIAWDSVQKKKPDQFLCTAPEHEHDFKTDDYYIGDPHRNLIAKQIFEVNGQALQIESTSNDSLVVIGQTDYKVCPACGYASETGIPLEHKNSRGYRCVNKEGNSAEYRLSHDFKTDVAKITFATQEAADINVMLSVLYALLEGLSREMGIERTDIKGCLFYTSVDGCIIFSVVLYDAVAGGAGHVRRIVTADGQAFQRVLAKAISVVDNCDCDSSCYRCLRNYYNQKIHDNLNRNQASAFLHQWVGNMNPLPVETIE